MPPGTFFGKTGTKVVVRGKGQAEVPRIPERDAPIRNRVMAVPSPSLPTAVCCLLKGVERECMDATVIYTTGIVIRGTGIEYIGSTARQKHLPKVRLVINGALDLRQNCGLQLVQLRDLVVFEADSRECLRITSLNRLY